VNGANQYSLERSLSVWLSLSVMLHGVLRWKHQNCLHCLRFDGAGLLHQRVPRTEKVALQRCSRNSGKRSADGVVVEVLRQLHRQQLQWRCGVS